MTIKNQLTYEDSQQIKMGQVIQIKKANSSNKRIKWEEKKIIIKQLLKLLHTLRLVSLPLGNDLKAIGILKENKLQFQQTNVKQTPKYW